MQRERKNTTMTKLTQNTTANTTVEVKGVEAMTTTVNTTTKTTTVKGAEEMTMTTTVNGAKNTMAEMMVEASLNTLKMEGAFVTPVARPTKNERQKEVTKQVLALTKGIVKVPQDVIFDYNDNTKEVIVIFGIERPAVTKLELFKAVNEVVAGKINTEKLEAIDKAHMQHIASKLVATNGFVKASRKEMLRKDNSISIYGVQIEMDKRDNGMVPNCRTVFTQSTLAEGRVTREANINVAPGLLPIANSLVECQKLCNDFMYVSFDTQDGVVDEFTILYLDVQNSALYRVETLDGVEKYINIVTGQEVSSTEGFFRFRLVGATAAGQRLCSAYYINTTTRTESEIDELMDTITVGIWTKIKGLPVSVAEANKYNVRIFAAFTANVEAGPVETYAMFMGIMGFDKDKAKTEEVNEAPVDGHLLISEGFARTMLESLGFKTMGLSKETVLQLAVQVRPYSTKCFAETYTNSAIDEIILDLAKHNPNNIVCLDRNTMTEEDHLHLDMCFSKAQKEHSKFNGKVVIIGNSETYTTPNILTDLNGYKAPFDYSRVDKMTVLESPTDSTPKGSIQLFEKLLSKDKEATLALIKELAIEFFDKETKAIFNVEHRVPTVKELEKPFVAGLVEEVCPAFALSDVKGYQRLVSNFKKKCESKFNKMAFEFDGVNARISADYAAIFKLEVLAFDEIVVSNRIYKKFKESGATRAIGIKYPSMGIRELHNAKVVSVKEIVCRIKALDTTDAIKAALIDKYSNLNDGVAVISAHEEVKNMLAGLDFDFDMICFFFDKRINAILDGMTTEIVRINQEDSKEVIKEAVKEVTDNVKALGGIFDNIKVLASSNVKKVEEDKTIYGAADIYEIKDAAKFEYSYKTACIPFIKYATVAKGTNIGAITFKNDSGIFAMFTVDVMKAMMHRKFGVEGKGKYVGLVGEKVNVTDDLVAMRYTVSDAAIARCTEEMKQAAWTEANLRKIFEDLNRIYRYYQELAIDAAKTFLIPNLAIQLADRFKAAILVPVTFDAPVAEANFTTFEAYISNPDRDKTSYVFADCLSDLRTELFGMAAAVVEQLEAVHNQVGYDIPEEALKFWSSKFNAIGGVKKDMLMEALGSIQGEYGKVASHYFNAMKGLEVDSPVRAALSKERKDILDGLRNLFCFVTSDLTSQQRGSLGRVMNYYKITNKNFSLRTNADEVYASAFAESVVPNEFFMNVLRREDALQFYGEEIAQGFINPGSIVEFEDGKAVCENGYAMTVSPINGTFEITEHEGKLYATRNIQDAIICENVSNKFSASIGFKKDTTYDVIEATAELLRRNRNHSIKFKADGYTFVVDGLDIEFTTGAAGKVKHALMNKEAVLDGVVVFNNAEGKAYGIQILFTTNDVVVDTTSTTEEVVTANTGLDVKTASVEDLVAFIKSSSAKAAAPKVASGNKSVDAMFGKEVAKESTGSEATPVVNKTKSIESMFAGRTSDMDKLKANKKAMADSMGMTKFNA